MTKGNEEMENLAVGTNDLIEAAKAGNFTKVKYLMDNHPELIGNKDSKGRTALMWAAYRGFPKIVKKLVDNGTEVGMQDNQGRNALIYALSGSCRYDSNLILDIIQCFNPINGYSAIHKCAAILFNKTNETDSRNIDGITPLMCLSATYCQDLLLKLDSKKLKQLKCSQAFITDKDGNTAFNYAIRQVKEVAGESNEVDLNEVDLEKVGKFARDFPQYEQLLAIQKAKKEEQKAKQSKTNFQDDIGGLTDINDRISAATTSFPNKSHSKKFGKQTKGTEGQSLL